MTKEITAFKSEQDLKVVLANQYMKAIKNLFGDKDLALEFLTNVVASVQRVPKLLECTQESLLNSFMTMASLKLMPSGVSGEAYVLPYEDRNKGVCEAQFQLGYQGLVTLFYRAGVKSIVAEIIYEKDFFEYLNGEVRHVPDIFAEDRGEAKGAYVVIELATGGNVNKVMSKKEILAIGEKFSKTYGKGFSIWDPKNDPQLWTWKKTVLKQAAKLVPKNDALNRAVAEDNKESVIADQGPSVDLEAPRDIDLAPYKEALENCTAIEDLERVWADMPGAAKGQLKDTMESVKAMIMSASKDIT